MLQHTFHRAERLIPAERLFTVVGRDHLQHREVWQQLAGRTRGTVVLQPENKDTGPGLLLPLTHLHKRYPDSVTVLFPSDHFIMQEDSFMSHVELACQVVEQDPSRMVLLGIEPDCPEPEYGYILPGIQVNPRLSGELRHLSGFIEKPNPDAVKGLLEKGALWNIMVMAFKTRVLFELIQRVAPALYDAFHRVRKAIGNPRKMEIVEDVYRDILPVNFSKDLLEMISRHYPAHLRVLPVRNVFWSDWGSEQRIVKTLREISAMGSPEKGFGWVREWRLT
jgi:mannose-1-phosphate guanylyltransferase